LLKGDLRSLEPLHGEALVGALKEHVVPWWPFAPFDVATTNVLRAVIHPEIELENAVSIGHLETRPRDIHDQQDVIQVLDTNQEDHAQALGDGHRIVYGVAGSGKTILLLARAKRLVELGRKRILLVCYNRMLAAWLKRELHASPEVSVMTFHQWAGRMGIPFDPGMDDAALGVALLKQVSEHPTSASMYEAVLIDEAQDFEPDWFRCLLTAMEDPENGDLLIVADGCQSLYRRSKISWKSLGIKARGRTISSGYQLHQNYRNASEVIALAESFAFRSTDEDDLDAIQSVRVDLSRCQRSSGASPLLLECDDRRSELNQAFQIARDLLKGRWRGCPVGAFQPGEIAMLYPNAPGHAERELLEEFAGWMACKGIPCSWLSRNSWARDDAANDRLKIQTIHSAKGLQYLAVIILWADKLPRCSESRLSDRRLLYVGMTRAISLLAITASRRSAFVDEVASCPAVDVHRCSQYAASVIQSNSASNPAGEADPSPALVI
jgi:superfamily I DNA/RNA helicase